MLKSASGYRLGGIWLAGLVLCWAAPASAQVLYGSLVGTVTDGTGAVVPGAAVTALNPATGIEFDSSTGADGLFRIVNVQIGSYDVSVTSEGFRTHTESSVNVTANAVTRVDVDLVLGQVTEQVTVEASAAQLQTEKADTRSEITQRAITNFPLPNFRNYQSLVNLVPGATPARFQNSILDTPARALSTNVNGTNRNNNVTRIDGAASINVWLPHHAGYIAPAETIETVNITTGSGDAEQGLSGGASTTVITKSGTNEVHGSAFLFFDNDKLRARNFFAASKPSSDFKNFGGTVGGPIVRNKLFFFFGYDKTSQAIAGVRTGDEVPTADQRMGDFSAYGNTIYNPYTGNPDGTGRIPFPNKTVPASLQDPIALRVQSYYPEPNQPGTNNNFHSKGSPPFDRAYYDTKINLTVNDKYSLWGKHGYMDAPVSGTPIFGEAGGPAPGGSPGNAETYVHIATFGHTYTFTPTFFYDGVVGYWRQDQFVNPTDLGQDFNLGIPGLGGPDPRQVGFPRIQPGPYTRLGAPGWQPLERVEENWTTSQNFTWAQGSHQVRFGFDGILLKLAHWQPELGGGPRGTIDFNGDVTSLKGGASPGQFNHYAAFLLGETSRMRKAIQHVLATGNEWQFAWYATDRWQVNQRLTVNLGLRWEFYPLMSRAGGKGIERYDPETNLMYLGGRGGVPKNAGIDVSSGLLSPRGGIAYRIDDRTVLRTGFGLNYSPMPFSRPMRGQYPITVAFDFQRPNTFELFRSLADGIPPVVGPDLDQGVIEVPLTAGFRSPYESSVHGPLNRGYIASWNFTVERRLPGDLITSVGYVATRSVDMLADQDINASRPGEGNAGRPYAAITGRKVNINMWDSYLSSDYHSLQVAINRSFSKGVMLKGAYTWSKALGMADDEGWAGVSWDHPDVFHRNRARTGFDRTHMFQMGFVYDLPFLRNNSTAAGKVLGNWQISGIAALITGPPRTISASGSSLNAASASQTADQVGTVRKLGGVGPGQHYYDPSAFEPVTEQRFGTSGRNILDTPGVTNLDLSIIKNFSIGETSEVQFRAEFFNLTNTPQFGRFNDNVNSGGFMTITSTNAFTERVIRIGLRFSF
jgi:outer membrane receptor protein involved in Fe transport